MRYRGKERRRRWVYTTKNTEYHAFDGVCVAVRDVASGRWLSGHSALGRRIEGGVRIFDNGALLPDLETPQVGQPMYFVLPSAGSVDDEEQIVTSRLQDVGRPDLGDIGRYRRAARSS